MNRMRLPLALIALLFVVVFLVRSSLPDSYDWKPSFAHRDYNPFGAALFDSVMASSLDGGYVVTSTSFIALESDSSLREPVTVLLVDTYLSLDSLEIARMNRFIARGNHVVLCFDRLMCPTEALGVGVKGYESTASPFTAGYKSIAESLGADTSRVWLRWSDGGNGYPAARYRVQTPLILYTITDDEPGAPPVKTLLTVDDGVGAPQPVAVTRGLGRGRLTLVTLTRLMTNYGVLAADAGTPLMRLLAPVRGPVIRIDESMLSPALNAHSPYRFVLENRPLRWAFYLLLAVCAVALCFTARRRQRVIPVAERPVNRSLLMVEHIGTLYYEYGDHRDLLRKRVAYFADELRRETLLDWDDDTPALAAGIARVTRLTADDVRRRVAEVKSLLDDDERPLTAAALMRAIDHINLLSDEVAGNL